LKSTPQAGFPVSGRNGAKALAANCAWSDAASSEAIRNGGFSTSVPRAVLADTAEVGLSLPQAASAASAKYKVIRRGCVFMQATRIVVEPR